MSAADRKRLPTRAEIADPRDPLDSARAIEHFHGRTLAEAEALFASAPNSLTFTEDLTWMRPVGFRYYVRAAIGHALSERGSGDPDLINGIAGALESHFEQHLRELAPCAAVLADFCRAVVERFDRYDADSENYPGLREKYERFLELFTRLSNGPGNG